MASHCGGPSGAEPRTGHRNHAFAAHLGPATSRRRHGVTRTLIFATLGSNIAMGRKYFDLAIGRSPLAVLAWKHLAPPAYLLMFSGAAPIACPGADAEDVAMSFELTGAEALAALRDLGLTPTYFEHTWDSMRGFARERALSFLDAMISVAKAARGTARTRTSTGVRDGHVIKARERLAHISATQELDGAIALVRRHGWKDWNTSLLGRRDSLLPFLPAVAIEELSQNDVIEALALGAFLHDGQEFYPEIVSLFELFILLNAIQPHDTIRLTLPGEYISTAEGAREVIISAVDTLAMKVQLYGRTFVALTDGVGSLRRRLRREELSHAWNALSDPDVEPATKGTCLEAFAVSLLSDVQGLSIEEKNLRTPTAELDLVVRNGVSGAFWGSLGSPLIFVECKNWQRPVDARESRVLESKMRDRGRLARLGILLSTSGFTTACVHHALEVARDGPLLVTIDSDDVHRLLVDPTLETVLWLEQIVARQAAGHAKARGPRRARRR